MSETAKKTLLSAIVAIMTVPLGLLWTQTADAQINLKVPFVRVYLIIALVFIYSALRILASFRVPEKILPGLNLATSTVDLLTLTYTIVITGGENSVFYGLFWSTIVSTTIFFGVKGTLASSAAMVLLYPLASYASQTVYDTSFDLSADLLRVYQPVLVSIMLALMVREERFQRRAKESAQYLLFRAQREQKRLQERLALAALSRRQLEVLNLIREGLDNQTIAERLFLSKGTVAKHVASILDKLEVGNRTQAALVAERALGQEDDVGDEESSSEIPAPGPMTEVQTDADPIIPLDGMRQPEET